MTDTTPTSSTAPPGKVRVAHVALGAPTPRSLVHWTDGTVPGATG